MVRVRCSGCGKVYFRSWQRDNEAKKFGWKAYCSLVCLGLSRRSRQKFSCSNPNCDRIVERTPGDLAKSGRTFCSSSCAAIVINSERVINAKRTSNQIERFCANPECQNVISARNKYCSNKCSASVKKISSERYGQRVVSRIRKFYKENGRIPFKMDLPESYVPARRAFGTWNKAIEAAGYEPNPVKFARKYTANDGHPCDSLAEKIIDDWLFARKIAHEVKVPYNYRRMSADFKVNGTLIEFLGLSGELGSYDRLVKIKKRLWRERNLNVIEIYPNHLFPDNKLGQVLKSVS